MTLDSLIFNKINDYRASVGSPKFKAFEDSSMRAFSYRMTRKNSTLADIKHTDSCGYFHNIECVFYLKLFGDKSVNSCKQDINSGNFENLAEEVFQGWLNSPTHNYAMKQENYYVATVTSRITIDLTNKFVRVDASYHALANNMGTINHYSYLIKKRDSSGATNSKF